MKCSCFRFARQVFDRMPQWDSVSYDSMIDGFTKCGLIESKEEEYKTMFNIVVLKASHKTIQNVLKALVLQPKYISYSYKEKRCYIMGGT